MCNFKFFVFRKYTPVIISSSTLEIISRILELVEADLPIFAVCQNGKSRIPIAHHYLHSVNDYKMSGGKLRLVMVYQLSFVCGHENSTHSAERLVVAEKMGMFFLELLVVKVIVAG
jgi:hypothetical protein